MQKRSNSVGYTGPMALILVILILLFSFIEPSSASRVESRFNQAPVEVHNKRIEIDGDVICKMPPVNNGEPCPIMVREVSSGKVFNLTNARPVRRVHSDGQNRVFIEGFLRSPTSVEVLKAGAPATP